MKQAKVRTYLALGTNLGDKERNIHEAVRLLGERVGEVICLSSLHETEPVGFSSENNFLNAAVSIDTCLSPDELLTATQAIEQEMGRMQKSVDGIYHDRIIDIDILLYGDLRINTPHLIIPHPRMHERAFVMEPLKEIAPLPLPSPEGEGVETLL